MSESLALSPRLYYLQASNPKSKGGDAPDSFANEELLPMIWLYVMTRKWRRMKKNQQMIRS